MAEFVDCPSCGRTIGAELDSCPYCYSRAVLYAREVSSGATDRPSRTPTAAKEADSAAMRERIDQARLWETRRTRLERYQSAIGLGTFLQLLLGIATLVSIYAVWLDVAYRNALTGLVDGTVSIDDAITIEDQWGLSGMIDIFMYVTVGIVWIIWMWRLYRNVEALGRRRGHSIHWCIWGWVIPIGSLWIPRMVTGDIWAKSDPEFSGVPDEKVPWIINLWWGLFLISVVFSRSLGFGEPDDIDGWISLATTYAWFDSLGVVLAVVSVVVVRRLTNRQSNAHRAVQVELRDTMPQ